MHSEGSKDITIAGSRLFETAHRENSTLEEHAHDDPYLCYVVSGQFTEYNRSVRSRYSRANLIVHPPGTSHKDIFHSHTRCFNVQFTTGSSWAEYFQKSHSQSSKSF